MEKRTLIHFVYQTATLTTPSAEVVDILLRQPPERILEILLVMRQSPRPVKSPSNFIRRAISEGWTPETMPMKINRSRYESELKIYQKMGYSLEEAKKIAFENQQY